MPAPSGSMSLGYIPCLRWRPSRRCPRERRWDAGSGDRSQVLIVSAWRGTSESPRGDGREAGSADCMWGHPSRVTEPASGKWWPGSPVRSLPPRPWGSQRPVFQGCYSEECLCGSARLGVCRLEKSILFPQRKAAAPEPPRAHPPRGRRGGPASCSLAASSEGETSVVTLL